MSNSIPLVEHLSRLDHDAPIAVVLMQETQRRNCGRPTQAPGSIGEVTRKAGTALLATHRFVWRTVRDHRTAVCGIEAVRQANSESSVCVLSLPAEVLVEVLSHVRACVHTLMTLAATSVDLYNSVVTSISTDYGTPRLPWSIAVRTDRHRAIELALAVVHFINRGQMHGFFPTPNYRAVRNAILAEHRRVGIKLGVRVEHSGTQDANWPSTPDARTLIDSEALLWNPFDQTNEDSWVTHCPYCPDVKIACVAHTVGAFADSNLVLVTRSHYVARHVCAWWLPDGSVAVYAAKFREYRYVFSYS